MAKRRKNITDEDRELWRAVAKTVTPHRPCEEGDGGNLLKQSMARLLDQEAVSAVRTPGLTTATPRKASKTPAAAAMPPVNRGANAAKPAPLAKRLQNAKKGDHHPIDKRTAKKIAAGRLPIDARLDLHGMTQDWARRALFDFLRMAQAADYRIVLIITGKGNEGIGILRQRVPDWLRLPAYAALTNGFQEAHISHGGAGALYVRIRRLKRGR